MKKRVATFASHDYKFIVPFMNYLSGSGVRVKRDPWFRHTRHFAPLSRYRLATSDILFCEWGLGNAEWYSKRKGDYQKLFVRAHAQEIRSGFLARIDAHKVDRFIFVSEHMKAQAVAKGYCSPEQADVVYNFVNSGDLFRIKDPIAQFRLGLVGAVPRSKRLDLALDVIEYLLVRDRRYRLLIKGKLPSDLKWLKLRPDEMSYFENQMERIEQLKQRFGQQCVTLEPFGDNMGAFYQKIGHILSVSEHESFHLGLAEGMASGAHPHILNWPGAAELYGAKWLRDSPFDIMQSVLDSEKRIDIEAHRYVATRFDQKIGFDRMEAIVMGRKP